MRLVKLPAIESLFFLAVQEKEEAGQTASYLVFLPLGCTGGRKVGDHDLYTWP
jgi:hypothetical protein